MMSLLKELSYCLLVESQKFLYLGSVHGIRLGHGIAFLLKSGRKAVMKDKEEKEPQPSQISYRNAPISTASLKTHVPGYSLKNWHVIPGS